MLKANTSLRELSLAWNSFGASDDGCGHIAEGLICNSALERLDMSNCQLGHQSGSVLASCLITNSSLVGLDLRWNNLGALGGRSFLRAMEHNSTVRTLKLAGNQIPEDILYAIEAKVEQNVEVYKAITADAARARFMAEELEAMSAKSTEQISSLQGENEGLVRNKLELAQLTTLLQDRSKLQATNSEKLEARLELHQRELETKVRETTALTGTVLTLREEIAALRHASTDELSTERKGRVAAEMGQREAETAARTDSMKWQQEDAAYQLKARLLQGEIDNQKQELVCGF